MLLIDGDQFLFTAAVAIEREIRWDDQNHVLYSNVERAWETLVGMIERIEKRFAGQGIPVFCFSKPPNFRTELDPTYKAGRDPRKPLCYAALRERAGAEWECKEYAGLEADDVMGILATRPRQPPCIIISQDKDMKTIPDTPIWDGKDLITYIRGEADYWHLYQTLVGDTADGYKGCPGVGPVKAEKILSPATHSDAERWALVVGAYENAGLCEQDALLQARLARILRWGDWDAAKKEPILWTPTPN